MAATSATVVNSLTASASLQCDEGSLNVVTGEASKEHPQLAKGTALGKFRSSGQLGRAIGPLLGIPKLTVKYLLTRVTACAAYWTFGPSVTYACAAVAMFGLFHMMKTIL
jgi:hypothetical protein